VPLKTISILGVGLLGGSIGLATKSLITGCKIIGYGHRPATLSAAIERGAIDQGTTNLQQAVADCDLVILCTPVGLFRPIIQQIAPVLSDFAIVTDVGSTKRSVVELAAKHLRRPERFVASHPMAGSEKRGVEFARSDLFKDALCLTTPTALTDPQALAEVEQFWRLLGMRITRLSPQEHDRWIGQISHLPHAVAAALVTMQDQASLALAGKGFMDATRIAAGDAGLWRDIFLDNRDNLSAGIQRMKAELDRLLMALDANDEEAVMAWLDAAASMRQAMTKEKQ
jgi:prephenate dehydrogenase